MAISYTPLRATLNDNDASTPVDAAWGQDVQNAIKAVYSLVTTKGDLIVATASGTLERRSIGANNTVPVAASAQSTGITWQQIGNAQVASNAAIAYSKLNLTGSLVNADTAFAAASYTPALTAASSNPTLGTGSTQTGKYWQLGDLVIGQVLIAFGSSGTNAGSGTYFVSLPVSSSASVFSLGAGHLVDSSTAARVIIACGRATATTMSMTVEAGTLVGEASPWAWAASDTINLFFMYEA